MSWSPGERADAHQVTSVLRAFFSKDDKAVSREFTVDQLNGAQIVVELWGGGLGIPVLQARLPGVRVISVEDGSVCKEWLADKRGRHVTKKRLERAFLIDCEERGVEAFWGSLEEAVAKYQPDTVWADFCAQWSGPIERFLDSLAGSSVRRLAIALMPERDGLGEIGAINRLAALPFLVSAHTRLSPIAVTSYRRNQSNQQMALIAFEQRKHVNFCPPNLLSDLRVYGRWPARKGGGKYLHTIALKRCLDCGASVYSLRKRRCHRCVRVRQRESAKRTYEKHMLNPEWAEQKRVAAMDRYRRLARDPEWRASRSAQQAAGEKRRMLDPDYRTRKRAKDRERHARRKAA